MTANVIFRVWGANEWRVMTAAEIAEGLNAPSALRPLSLLAFFQAAVEAGAEASELAKLWPMERYVDRFEAGLGDGDLAGVGALLATMPVALAGGTLAAIQTAVGSNAIGAGAAHWESVDGAIPAFTTEWVAGALATAGWGWNGSQWTRV